MKDGGDRPLQTVFLYAVFCASGVSSLICEITWNRMLVLVLGNTMAATGAILAAFMGGLVLGSYAGGRLIGRHPVSLLPYAVLEVGIGLYAVASPAFFHPASQLFTLAAIDLSAPALLMGARLTVAFACLLIPAFLMGATFPAIIGGTARLPAARTSASSDFGELSRAVEPHAGRIGYLYAVNTFGGAAGALLAGYVFLPRLGASLTLVMACLISLLAAFGALVLRRFAGIRQALARPALAGAGEPRPAVSPSSPVASEGATGPRLGAGLVEPYSACGELCRTVLRLVALATFLIGFVSLAYEVLLTRLVILYFGNTLVVFTLVVTAFLLGIGLSALCGTWGYGLSRSPHLMAGVTMLAGVCLVVPPFLLVALSSAGSEGATPYQDLVVGGIMLAPAFVLGSLLPIAIRIFQSQPARPNVVRDASSLYAVNTLGGMLAAGLTNPILVPRLGVGGTLIALSLASVIMGAALLWSQRPVRRRWVAVTACALAAILALPLSPYRLEQVYAQKLAAYSGQDIDAKVQYYHEGAVATAIVVDFPWLGFRDMFLNGVEEASTRFGHVQLFKLLGLLPVLVHESDEPKEALMIAFGAGIAAGSTLGTGLVSSLECVDLNPDIEPINDLFKEVNADVFRDPRFRFVAEDGRNYLLMRSKQYDVIISDSTHPRAYDSWILYTEEFYRLVRQRLAPDGVFAQWVPLSDISVEQYRILLNTFRRVFPNVTVWNIYGTDQAFLLATPEPFQFDLERIQKRLDRAAGSIRLKQYQLETAVKLAGFFVMDRDRIDAFIGTEARKNTDTRPFLQPQALGSFTPLKAQSFDRYQAGLAVHATHASKADLAAIADRQVLARAMHRAFFFNDDDALGEAALIDPAEGNVLFHQQATPARLAMLMEQSRRNRPRYLAESADLRQAISRAPDQVQAYVDLAELYLKLHRVAEADALLTTALTHARESLALRKARAKVYMVTDRWREAAPLLEDVLRSSPDDLATRRTLFELYAQHQEHRKALALFRSMGPSGEYDYQYYVTLAGAHFVLAEYGDAERELVRALAIYPGNTQARWYLSDVYLKMNRRAACVEQLQRLLEINPYHEPALTKLIGLYREAGHHDDAAILEAKLAHARALRAMQG